MGESKFILEEWHTKETLIAKLDKLIKSECHKQLVRALRLGEQFEDIEAEAVIGVIRAFNNYDETKDPDKFISYVVMYIRGSIRLSLIDKTQGPKFSAKVKYIGYRILREEWKDVELNELVERLEESPGRVKLALEFLEYGISDRLDRPLSDNTEDTLAETIKGFSDESSIFVEDFKKLLTPFEKSAVELMLMEWTQTETSRLLGVSEMTMSRSMKKIRAKYKSYEQGVEYVGPSRGPKAKEGR